jgi:hypothetical protein
MKRTAAYIILFIIAAGHLFTPHSAKRVMCGCGSGEFICYCCVKSHDYGNAVSLSKCRDNVITDESYTQLPATMPNSSKAFIISYKMNDSSPQNSVFLNGYSVLPFKPPQF